MTVLVRCLYRQGGAEERHSIRDVHLRFMIAQRAEIEAGGALLGPDGNVSGMFLLLACGSVSEAETFLKAEPYTKAGLFASYSLEVASRFIPSDDPHLLDTMLAWVEAQMNLGRSAVTSSNVS